MDEYVIHLIGTHMQEKGKIPCIHTALCVKASKIGNDIYNKPPTYR